MIVRQKRIKVNTITHQARTSRNKKKQWQQKTTTSWKKKKKIVEQISLYLQQISLQRIQHQ